MSTNFTERGLIKAKLFECEKSQNICIKGQTHKVGTFHIRYNHSKSWQVPR